MGLKINPPDLESRCIGISGQSKELFIGSLLDLSKYPKVFNSKDYSSSKHRLVNKVAKALTYTLKLDAKDSHPLSVRDKVYGMLTYEPLKMVHYGILQMAPAVTKKKGFNIVPYDIESSLTPWELLYLFAGVGKWKSDELSKVDDVNAWQSQQRKWLEKTVFAQVLLRYIQGGVDVIDDIQKTSGYERESLQLTQRSQISDAEKKVLAGPQRVLF